MHALGEINGYQRKCSDRRREKRKIEFSRKEEKVEKTEDKKAPVLLVS